MVAFNIKHRIALSIVVFIIGFYIVGYANCVIIYHSVEIIILNAINLLFIHQIPLTSRE